MTDPAGALAARIERFEQAADPELIRDPAALSEAEQAMRDLHTRLRRGESPAHALRAAVLELRELYGPAEPDLWASYVLAGLPEGAPLTSSGDAPAG
ncbi:hypothetical protein [Nonomuraea candida]|uniref:hypothetical protein n=1 Tax=Nonomuraea candida TaxID=359159 RepID=UPI0005B90695|nr:hypothetical protein [Nonomuraea candida]